MTNTGTPQVRLAGHAYRPTQAAVGRRVVPGCECGGPVSFFPTTNVNARRIHNDHKKAVIKALKAGE